MPERIQKLQPDRTLYLRGFDSFAAAASIHDASPAGFNISGTFRDPADFAVAVLYDADNFFEHPSIKYLPDFNFTGLTLDFSLNYTDSVQPIDSPLYNWIDWATLDVIRADNSTAKIPLWDNAMLGDASFPAACATLEVVSPTEPELNDEISLWHENLAFSYTVPGGRFGSATYSWQDAPSSASITVGSTTYTYRITTKGGEPAAIVAAGVASAALGDPLVSFSAEGGIVTFAPKVNTGAVVNVSGYLLWLVTDSPSSFIAADLTKQINAFNWTAANTLYGLIATNNGSSITLTAARYGSVAVTGTSVAWSAGAKFSGLVPG